MEEYGNRKNHYRMLLDELKNREHEKDILPNYSYDFAEERQAMYYTNMRWNMESDMAVMVMEHYQQLDELKLLKEWKKNEC